jgi:uncharacterized protein YjlB
MLKPCCAIASRRLTGSRMTASCLIIRNGRLSFIRARSAFRSPLDAAAVFEGLFDSYGRRDSWRDGIYDYVHYHSRIHEVLGIARGGRKVQLGGRTHAHPEGRGC